MAFRFEQLQDKTIEFIEEVERVAGAPVSLISTGLGRQTHYRQKRMVNKSGHPSS